MGNSLRGNDIVSCQSASGGTLLCQDEKGELMHEIYVPPGRHTASRFMVGLGRNHTLHPGDKVVCFPPDVVTRPIRFGEMAYETAASQNYKVDDRERQLRKTERLERRLSAQDRRQALLEKALAKARGQDPAEVAAEQARLREQAEAERVAEAARIAAEKAKPDDKPA